MKKQILLFAFVLLTLFSSAQSLNPANFNVDIKDVGGALSVKILSATTCGMSFTGFTLEIRQYFGEVANLWVDGQGWEGQESIGTILAAHPTWNFYGVAANGNCQPFYSTGTRTGAVVNGYYTRYRVFTGGVMVIYNAQIGTEYLIPYNDYSFNYEDANNSYPSDYGFGAGLLTDGAVHEISAIFSACWDASGKPIVVKKNVQVPSAAWSRYDCTTAPAPVVAPPVQLRKKK